MPLASERRLPVSNAVSLEWKSGERAGVRGNLQAAGWRTCFLLPGQGYVNKTPGSQWKSKVHQNGPGAQKFSFSKNLCLPWA